VELRGLIPRKRQGSLPTGRQAGFDLAKQDKTLRGLPLRNELISNTVTNMRIYQFG
jgi:hypothetical protein